jgi:predicted nucleic acid-binding protein
MIGQFGLLRELFGKVYIPESVYQEVVVKGKDRPGSQETEDAITEEWVKKLSAKDRLAVKGMLSSLGEGEAEAIVLAKELEADYILLDEEKAREIADSMDLNIMGTIGILSLAKKRGLNIDIKRKLDELQDGDFRISKSLYEDVIRESEN